MAVCCACGKNFKYNPFKGTGQELLKGGYACQECCDAIGIGKGLSGAFKASTYDRVKFLKKYAEVHPEATDKLNNAIEQKAKDKEAFKAELSEYKKKSASASEKAVSHFGCKKKTEEKYNCSRCGNVWYFGDFDKMRNLHNAVTLTTYNVNQLKNPSQCPSCGSSATSHKQVHFWIDRQGNCVDTEE